MLLVGKYQINCLFKIIGLCRQPDAALVWSSEVRNHLLQSITYDYLKVSGTYETAAQLIKINVFVYFNYIAYLN
jgi:hypothetical protein